MVMGGELHLYRPSMAAGNTPIEEMTAGEKVVCVDDKFEPWVFDLYRSLPKKGNVYTIRAVRSGRSKPKFGIDEESAEIKMTDAEFDLLVLLEELKNPNDPHCNVEQELGFVSERFAPMLEEAEEAEDFVSVGGGRQHELVPA